MSERHVDDFVMDTETHAYASWVLMHFRLPAAMQAKWRHEMKDMRLFCTHRGRRYRCTGASRMGDVWLAEDHAREIGYDHRVMVDDCTDWSATT